MTTKRTFPAVLLATCGLVATSLVIAAAQGQPPAVSSSAAESSAANEKPPSNGVIRVTPLENVSGSTLLQEGDSENGVFFTTEVPKLPQAAEMRRRLQDPEERKRLREEQRASVREQNPEITQVLQLDPSTEATFIELLTDERMEGLEHFWLRGPGADAPSGNSREPFMRNIQEHADAETRRLATFKELLGEEAFERYQDYKNTVSERMQAIRFDERLAPADKLAFDQKERLIVLLHEHRKKEVLQYAVGRPNLQEMLNLSRDPAARREQMLKQEIRFNAELIRAMEEASRQLLEKLPEVLTPQQVNVYAKMEAEKIAAQRMNAQKKLARDGLPPEALDEPVPAPGTPPRKAITGPIRLDVYFEVNRSKPIELSLRTENGKAVGFQAPEGLWVQATPTLYEDGWLEVDFKYYEGAPGRRREIGYGSTGTMARQNQQGTGYGGGGGTMLTGSKAYRISDRVNAASIAQK